MHTCMHTYIHAYIHTCIHTCMHAYIHTYMHAYIHVHTCTCMYMHSRPRGRRAPTRWPTARSGGASSNVYIYIYIYTYMYTVCVCMCMCICIYICSETRPGEMLKKKKELVCYSVEIKEPINAVVCQRFSFRRLIIAAFGIRYMLQALYRLSFQRLSNFMGCLFQR